MSIPVEESGRGAVQDVRSLLKVISLNHVDKSKAHTVQTGKDKEDMEVRTNACLEMINAIKETRAPSGVVLDPSKITPSPSGRYVEGEQYENLKRVLGTGNCAGNIVLVKDIGTGEEHAMKTVMLSEFRKDEVKAWVDLHESESYPRLYCFQLEGNNMKFHMEIVDGKTLNDIADEHMQESRDFGRLFSLCVFHGLLKAVQEMHAKKWSHGDLHGGNAKLTLKDMKVKILDFGRAAPLGAGLSFNHSRMKDDILNAVRLFSNLYMGDDFIDNTSLENMLTRGTLEEALEKSEHLTRKERMEVLQLISMTYDVVRNPQHEGYGDTTQVTEKIEGYLHPEKKEAIMSQAAAVLFPEYYRDQQLQSPMDTETADGVGGDNQPDGEAKHLQKDGAEKNTGFDMEAAAKAVPTELLLQIKQGFQLREGKPQEKTKQS